MQRRESKSNQQESEKPLGGGGCICTIGERNKVKNPAGGVKYQNAEHQERKHDP